MKSGITDTDKGWSVIQERLAELGRIYTKVGLPEGAKIQSGDKNHLTLIEVAATHEFGSEKQNIPERSWLRATVDKNIRVINEAKERIKDRVIRREITAENGIATLGEFLVQAIKKRIREHIQPELKQATIDRKGSSTPLIDTGQFINSITHVEIKS